jgi:osmotically-inducible protein OsmY
MKWLAILTVLLVSAAAVTAPAADPITDDHIYDRVRLRLAGDRDVRGTAIEVKVENGVVTLSGQVQNEKARQRAAKLAKKEKGVKQVVNQLTVRP